MTSDNPLYEKDIRNQMMTDARTTLTKLKVPIEEDVEYVPVKNTKNIVHFVFPDPNDGVDLDQVQAAGGRPWFYNNYILPAFGHLR